MRQLTTESQFESLKKEVLNSTTAMFPVKGTKHTLVATRVWIDDSLDPTDYKSQKNVKLGGGTWGIGLYADLELQDLNGKVIDKATKLRLMTLPRITPRGSYIVSGNEYQVVNQLRLKSGVYTYARQGGGYKTVVNLAKGKNFNIDFDPASTVFKVKLGQGNPPLYPILKHLGVTDEEMRSAWGQDILLANQVTGKKEQQVVQSASKYFTGKPASTAIAAADHLKQYFEEKTQMSPDTTKLTLGQAFTNVTPRMILAASKKHLLTQRGDLPTEDRDSLSFKELHSIEDFMKERLDASKNSLTYKIKRNLDSRTKIRELFTPGLFNNIVHSFFTQDDKSGTPEQTNPLHMIGGHGKITFTRSGGIGSEFAITKDLRQIHPTHFGFLDPIHTPEGPKIGADLHLPIGVIKDGKTPKTPVLNVSTLKSTYLSPAEMQMVNVALSDQYTIEKGKLRWKGATVKAMSKGEIQELPTSAIQFLMPAAWTLFSYASNVIPFLQNNQGNRAMMASKHVEQAISLKDREVPLIQTGVGTPHGDSVTSFQKLIGGTFSAHAPEDGVVDKITANEIIIKNKEGKHTVNLYDNFPLNQKSFLHHTPHVKVGDKVSKGELLADSNFTKGGTLALGRPMRVAYIPYKGLGFEDGIVVTETAARKLTSEHIYNEALKLDDDVTLNLRRFRAEYPNAVKGENLNILDDEGIVKKGSLVKHGDVLIAGLRKEAMSNELWSLQRINRNLRKPNKPYTMVWKNDDNGKVLDIIKSTDSITVLIKTEEAAKIGDKLSGTYGNKGVITHILNDADAPKDKEGKPVEIMLNPHGIISRINIGQIYESALAKVAKKTGKPITVDNFAHEDYSEKVKAALKEHGIDDKEELFGADGKKLGRVHVGYPYILKLFKQSTSNFSARSTGGYDINRQPVRGGEEGGKAMDLLTIYSMLAHGSRANLKDATLIKGGENEEYWRALIAGRPLPPLKTPFVYDKLLAMMKGAGINVKHEGTNATLEPLTDKAVREVAKNKIEKPLFVDAKDFKPKKGGFFDTDLTGGLKGDKWSYIELHESVPNPVFEVPIKKITGLGANFEEVMKGRAHVDDNGKVNTEGKGVTGPKAIKRLLDKINVTKELTILKEKLKTAPASSLDDINKRVRYLQALKEADMTPTEAYMRKLVPVIPPQYRPMYPMQDGNITTSSANYLYQNVGIMNIATQHPVMNLLPDKDKAEILHDLYEQTKSLAGLKDVTIKGKEQKGFISQIAGKGSSPKEGFFLSSVISKKQDLVGRGTIIPEPKLHVDEIALPEKMAYNIYKPFIKRELVRLGRTPLQADEEVEKRTLIAQKALEAVMKERPVLFNRAPSLHKFSIMAMKPQLTSGTAIKMPPMVCKSFGADFDGDEQIAIVIAFLSKDSINKMNRINGSNYLEERKMSARFKTQLPALNKQGEIFVFNLEDFPHEELIGSKQGAKGRIDFYTAPVGTKVIAYDEKNQKLLWADVAGWSRHYDREIEIVNLASGDQIISDDDPRAVYGVEQGSLNFVRNTPAQAVKKGMFVPRAVRLKTIITKKGTARDLDLGYLCGAAAANGWCEHMHGQLTGRVILCNQQDAVGNRFLDIIQKYFRVTGKRILQERLEATDGSYGPAKKWGIVSDEAAHYLLPQIGHGAKNKHLPPCFVGATAAFHRGLFAGLLDNDGSIGISNGKAKPQLMSSYTSCSLRLIQEIQLLAKLVGIRSTITPTKTPAGEAFWCLTFSAIDIKRWNGFRMQHPEKLRKLKSVSVNEKSGAASKMDIVPISTRLVTDILQLIGASRGNSSGRKSIWRTFNRSKHVGSLSRNSAKALLKYVTLARLQQLAEFGSWWAIVQNTDITWSRTQSYLKTGIKETGFDLTVPGYETFMSIDGVMLSNTMTAHVPISTAAVKEAFNMLPSKHLYKPGTGELTIVPSQEAAVGLYFISHTAEGRKKINAILPKDVQIDHILDKKTAKLLLTTIAQKHHEQYADIVSKLKHIGDDHAYDIGFSVGLEDVDIPKAERDKLYQIADKLAAKTNDPGKKYEIYDKTKQALTQVLAKRLSKKSNNFFHMVNSGARGGYDQLLQIMATPGLITDTNGAPILKPIRKSYGEGLDMADYWTSLYGARRGMMDRSLSTSVPGALSKDLIANVLDNVVGMVDCGTTRGISFDRTSRELLGRYTATAQGGIPRNTLITAETIRVFMKAGLKQVIARSPLTCQAPKGVCQHCHGIDENGKLAGIGDNVGVKAGQTLSEPLTQGILRTFHTGGVAGATKLTVGGFDRIKQLFEMPKYLPDKAPLAASAGKITKIEKAPAGGHFIHIGEHKHYAPRNAGLKVKLGQTVEKGDALSEGIIQPQDLVEHKGMMPAQNYLVGELQNAYRDLDAHIDRKTFETVVRSIGNVTRITKASQHAPWVEGDIVPYTVVDHFNRNLKEKKLTHEADGHFLSKDYGILKRRTMITKTIADKLKAAGIHEVEVEKDPVEHQPTLIGFKFLPFAKRNWMAQLGYRNIGKTLVEGAGMRWTSDLQDHHPIPAFAYGKTFGEGKDGKY